MAQQDIRHLSLQMSQWVVEEIKKNSPAWRHLYMYPVQGIEHSVHSWTDLGFTSKKHYLQTVCFYTNLADNSSHEEKQAFAQLVRECHYTGGVLVTVEDERVVA